MAPTAEKSKAPPVIVTLTITWDGKEDMTFADFAAEGKKAEAIREANKQFGAVAVEVAVGKQKVRL